MPKKRRLSDIRNRCRICLVDHGYMSNLFDEIFQLKIKDLSKCTSIDIKNDEDFPSKVCHVCLYKLEMWNEFKMEFVRSNQMLLSQLQLSEASDETVARSKRKHSNLEVSCEDSLSDNPQKKFKLKVPQLLPLDFVNVGRAMDSPPIQEIYISDDEPTSSKDSSQKIYNVSDSDKPKNEEENKNDNSVQARTPLASTKSKGSFGKRGRTTERRKASTKRWVARKKALLAATGEIASDTDSVESDEIQLSPVQKARAKTNADKEIERQRRLAKALKNLETNMAGKYGIKHDSDSFMVADTDLDARRTRSHNESKTESSIISVKDQGNRNAVKKDKSVSQEDLTEKKTALVPLSENVADKPVKKNEAQIDEDTFTPCLVKSEIEIGNATYIVTSTLILAEPHYLNKANLTSFAKDCRNGTIEQIPQEKNTDIIDAVELRRVRPVQAESTEKKCIERCLNIEVEGTEIEALKRVQVELAGFIEKEMKPRLFGTCSNATKKEVANNSCKTSYQTLDQQLKSIVEKTIKKNFESSMMNLSCANKSNDLQRSKTVSPAFVTAAMNSVKYQPKVVLKRLDVAKENKQQKINNLNLTSAHAVKNKLSGPFSMVTRKRPSVLPKRYNDYNTSPLDSNSELSDEIELPEISKSLSNHYIQKSQTVISGTVVETLTQRDKSVNRIVESDLTIPRPVATKSTVTNEHNVENRENPIEKHICGVCHQSFDSRDEVTAHVRVHKTDSAVPRPNKHKMMRCKRCHEIVEARFVKSHVCKSTKQVHKCYVCNSTFRTEKLLVRHLDSHDQSDFNIENITKAESTKATNPNAPETTNEMIFSKTENDQSENAESCRVLKTNNVTGTTDSQSEKIVVAKGLKSDGNIVERPKETYTCFVCDKIFTDEEVLKDHLQKHCDDASEDEHSTGREQYQCAICGDSMESEDALEAHVEKHLFDDEDDNPNLISIAHENEKPKDNNSRCLQCGETFSSEMLLEMHMQAHEEEAAIAEWAKQGIKTYEFQCAICDELFETEEELSEHLDVHNGNAHVCQLCEKPLPTLEDLQRHVASH